jgi:hypothetical protein
MTTPSPPPPPHPLPPASPTLNLPPDVVDKLAPHHSVGDWLYSQGATLLSVLIAIYAARRAWQAVQAQIAANQSQLTDQIEAENQRQKRTERLSALTDAAGTVSEIWCWATQRPLSGEQGLTLDDLATMGLKVSTLIARLTLLEMLDQRQAVAEFWHMGTKTVKDIRKMPDLALLHLKVIRVLTTLVDD